MMEKEIICPYCGKVANPKDVETKCYGDGTEAGFVCICTHCNKEIPKSKLE